MAWQARATQNDPFTLVAIANDPKHLQGQVSIPVLLPVPMDARVVHEDADAAEAFDASADHAVHGIVIGDIARYGMNAILVAERIL